ncbi:MAG: lipoyl synthase [Acidimicrobiales bacterium]
MLVGFDETPVAGVRVRWLGRVPYREAWALQRALCRRSEDDYLLLLEHNHVYTLGSNADIDHMLVDPASVGADMVKTDRGGDITYHGPGQLVGYPIISVAPGPHRGPEHVERVEQVIIDALVSIGVHPGDVGRLPGYPGVWIGLHSSETETGPDPIGDFGRWSDSPRKRVGPRKICAVGIRTTRGRTMHGFALNVHPDLSMFGHIVPCGIADKPVTSLSAEGIDVDMAAVTDAVIGAAIAMWGPLEDVQRVIDGRERAPVLPRRRAVDRVPVPVPVPVAVSAGRASTGERSINRRLRRSGVDPDGGLAVNVRKPPWLRVQARMGDEYLDLRRELRQLDLVTVCEEAGCPNIYECWSDGTATFMINGSRCTRACGFCQVDTRHPLPLDAGEPERVAEAVGRMGLAHAVITCVARDDLVDGGAGGFAATIGAVRRRSPKTAIEVLISDCKGDDASLRTIFDAGPDIVNHNIETVARLQRAVRPSAGYARSLAVLAGAKDAGLVTKSGIILGMGERRGEVLATLADLRAVGVGIVTLGQYLRPSSRHVPVDRWWRPEEFDSLRLAGLAMGFRHVQASPLTRSSYHAREAAGSAATGGSQR